MLPREEEFPRGAAVVGFSIVPPARSGTVTTVSPLQGAQQENIASGLGIDAARRDDVACFASALSGLLADVRMGKVTATAPGDRWLALRVEEALRGFDDIQQMAVGHEPAPWTGAGATAGAVSILAPRVQALGLDGSRSRGLPVFGLRKKCKVR